MWKVNKVLRWGWHVEVLQERAWAEQERVRLKGTERQRWGWWEGLLDALEEGLADSWGSRKETEASGYRWRSGRGGSFVTVDPNPIDSGEVYCREGWEPAEKGQNGCVRGRTSAPLSPPSPGPLASTSCATGWVTLKGGWVQAALLTTSHCLLWKTFFHLPPNISVSDMIISKGAWQKSTLLLNN